MYLPHASGRQIDNPDRDSPNSNLREKGSFLKKWRNGDRLEI